MLGRLSGTRTSFHRQDDCGDLDFAGKNFEYVVEDFGEFLERARFSEGTERRMRFPCYYYRATNRKGKAATLENSVEAIRDDFVLPTEILFQGVEGAQAHSSVLRMCSPGIRVWIHYDTLDNVLCQVTGRKRILLWPPRWVNDLGIAPGSSSSRFGSMGFVHEEGVSGDSGGSESRRFWEENPEFRRAWGEKMEFILSPGDVLRIPALWPHSTEDVLGGERPGDGHGLAPCDHDLGISVNVFYRCAELHAVCAPKDHFCNTDYPVFTDALKAIKAVEEKIPARAREFYLRKLLAMVQGALEADEEAGNVGAGRA